MAKSFFQEEFEKRATLTLSEKFASLDYAYISMSDLKTSIFNREGFEIVDVDADCGEFKNNSVSCVAIAHQDMPISYFMVTQDSKALYDQVAVLDRMLRENIKSEGLFKIAERQSKLNKQQNYNIMITVE